MRPGFIPSLLPACWAARILLLCWHRSHFAFACRPGTVLLSGSFRSFNAGGGIAKESGDWQIRVEGATLRTDLRRGSSFAEGDAAERPGLAGAVQEGGHHPEQGSVYRPLDRAGARPPTWLLFLVSPCALCCCSPVCSDHPGPPVIQRHRGWGRPLRITPCSRWGQLSRFERGIIPSCLQLPRLLALCSGGDCAAGLFFAQVS